MQICRLMVEQKGECVIDLRFIDEVIVIKYQDDVLGNRCDLIDDDGHQVLIRRQSLRFEQLQGAFSNVCRGCDLADACGQIDQEPFEIVVILIDRQPGEADTGLVRPAADQRGFAKTGRR